MGQVALGVKGRQERAPETQTTPRTPNIHRIKRQNSGGQGLGPCPLLAMLHPHRGQEMGRRPMLLP